MYEGEFKDDQCSGLGTLHYPDGKKYIGLWKEGKKHGKGYYEWPNGAKYHLLYNDGNKRVEMGKLDGASVSLDDLRNSYSSVAKKAANAKKLQI